MKKLLFIVMTALISLNLYAHCGSCGSGGSEEDHAHGEDTEHHERDAKFKEVGKKKEAFLNQDDDEDTEPSDSEDDY
ncbi:MAG: hypothetical protein VXV96_12660 [Bdellovibrionota bacterium]|jgi:hypothetical protein|nr:hypothetical protein [Bdellovibrionota bacterium]